MDLESIKQQVTNKYYGMYWLKIADYCCYSLDNMSVVT